MSEKNLSELRFWHDLFRIGDWLRDSAAPSEAECGVFSDLSLRHLHVMRIVATLLEDCPEGITLKTLAEELKLTPGTVSCLVDTLVNRNALLRVQSKVDRREVKISLTPSSRELIEKISARIDVIAEDLLSCLTPEERKPLIGGLNKMMKRIKQIKDRKQ